MLKEYSATNPFQKNMFYVSNLHEAIQGLLDLYQKEKVLSENHKLAFEKQTENLHELEDLYQKEKEKKGYTTTEIENIEKHAYYRGRADEELKWKNDLEQLLEQAEEKYKTYKKGVAENEALKMGMWRHLGEMNLLKTILGKAINIVTLD